MAENVALDLVTRPFSFAVVGDAHFKRNYWLGESTDRPLEAPKYVENVRYALAPMVDSLKLEDPEFIVLTGDLVEGQGEDREDLEELRAGLEFFATCEIPLLFARGNHEGAENFNRVILPYLSGQLGKRIDDREYSLDVANCRLIFLDTTDWKRGQSQGRWLEEQLSRNRNDIGRIFVFGHHPIWPIARAFFTNLEFQQEIPGILARFPIDAYFCGHTHNQSILQHRSDSSPILQFMGAPIGLSDEPPIALDRVQALLHSPDDLLEYWPGYLENTAPGWFMVYVDDRSVQVKWYHLNRGAEAIVKWYRTGEISSFWQMKHPPEARLIDSDLTRIRRATLRYCAWDATDHGKEVYLNGEFVGDLPRAEMYAPHRMDLPNWTLDGIRMENRLEIKSSKGPMSTLGNLVLEVILPGGRAVRTRPTGEIFSWSDPWRDPWRDWKEIQLKKVRPGRPIVTMLCFR